MPTRPQISLIIPVYNVETYLEECLQSVAQQTVAPLEVILVNDGSTDKSPDICKRFCRENPSWIYLEQPNQGVAAARKNGLARAAGEYITFVDADDFLSPDYCEQLWTARERTGAELVIAPMWRYFGTDGHTTAPEGTVFEQTVLTGPERVRVFENFSASMALCGKLFSRNLAEKAGLVFPSFRTGDDILPSVQLLAQAQPIVLAPRAKYYYRQARPASQSASGRGRFEGLFEGFLQARNYLLKTNQYKELAPGFERVRLVCLTSFMEKFGLTKAQRTFLQQHKNDLKTTRAVRRNWPWKLRLRAGLLSFCLSFHLPYDILAGNIKRVF